MRETKEKLQDVIKHAVDIMVALGTSWETMDPFRRDRMRSTVEVFATWVHFGLVKGISCGTHTDA